MKPESIETIDPESIELYLAGDRLFLLDESTIGVFEHRHGTPGFDIGLPANVRRVVTIADPDVDSHDPTPRAGL
jgi:hypothetical protein